MSNTRTPPNSHDADAAIRARIIERAKSLAVELIARFQIAAEDLANGNHHGALGALAGLENDLATIRCILLLLS